MVDLAVYERRGDLDAAFELTKKHQRAQEESERIHNAVHCELPMLTWKAYQAGEPCPGCGRPYLDEEHWEFRGTMHMTPEERARYDSEEDRYREAHGECHASRFGVAGSLTLHCGKCCPSPPLSPERIEKIARLLGRPSEPHELMQWRLRLFCGHIVEQWAHRSHKTIHAAFTRSVCCPECGLNPATIVDAEAIGLAGAPAAAPKPAPSPAPRKPSRAQLEARLKELEAEVERLQRGQDT